MEIRTNRMPDRRLFRRSIIAIMIGMMVVTGTFAGLTFGQEYDDPDQQNRTKIPDGQGADTTDVRVARISLINDHISFQRGDDEEWYDATMNTPVQAGDRLYTGDQGKLELQLDGVFLRLDKLTGLDVIDLSSHIYQFRLFAGTATIRLNRLPDQPLEIDTPGGAVTLLRTGTYRINVLENGNSEVLVNDGRAEVFNNGSTVTVSPQERMTIDGGGSSYYDISSIPQKDDWDVWNNQRDAQLAQAESPKYVEKQVAGVEDLDHYGKWVNTPEYGNAWQPEVSSDWAPYQDGSWTWRDPYGWSWVSNEPWGWAPYHYGRWAYVGTRWCWVPSGLGFYSPALVGFLGFGGGGFVGWVPLAPFEIFTPWWRAGRGYYYGNRRFSGGIYANNFFFNQRYRSCLTIFPRDRFIGGRLVGFHGTGFRDGFGPSRPILANSILPTRRSLAVGPVNSNFRSGVFNRTVIAKNNSAPVVSRFSDNRIRANGGMPVSQFQTTAGGGRATRPIYSNNVSGNRDGNRPWGDRSTGFVRRNSPSDSRGYQNRNSVDSNAGRNNNGGVQRTYDRSTNGTNENRPTRAIDRPFVPPSNNRPGNSVNNGSGGNERRNDARPQINSNQPSRSVDRSREQPRQSAPQRSFTPEARPSRPQSQERMTTRPSYSSQPRNSPPPRNESRTQSRPSSSYSSGSRGSSRPSSAPTRSSGGSSHSSGSSGRSSGGSGHRGH